MPPPADEPAGRAAVSRLRHEVRDAIARAALLLAGQAQRHYRMCLAAAQPVAALRAFDEAEALRQSALRHASRAPGAGDLMRRIHGSTARVREAALQSLRDPRAPDASDVVRVHSSRFG